MPSTPTVEELSRLLASRSLTARDLLSSRRKAISRYDAELNAFITVFKEDAGSRSGNRLRGITLAVKDNICVRGHRTTAGSRILRGFVAASDADVVTQLKNAGMVVVGKTNLHEFAYGVTGINPHFGDCRNPWARERISGGSSGGSAVAVATGMACAAIGTDTAGSVRIPAALCGVVGYKPTFGLISRRGVVPLSWSLDTVGFLTRSAGDAALLASAAGVRLSGRRRKRLSLKGLRIGVPQNILEPLDEDVGQRYEGALAAAESEGARLVRFDFLHFEAASACRTLIGYAEAAAFHRRNFTVRYAEYGPDLRLRLAQGLAIPAAVYLDAQRARRSLLGYYRSLFRKMDLMALPTTRIAAPTLRASKDDGTAPGIRTALLALTEPFNLFGAPAISIPCGLTRGRLPVGLQLAGDLGADDQLLTAAASFEQRLPKTLERLALGN